MAITARIAALVFVALLAACGSKGSPAGPSPQPPTQSQFSVRIDGVSWTPASAFLTSQAGNTVILAGAANSSRLLSIGFSGPAKAGVHRIEYIEDLPVVVTYFEGGPNGPAWTSFAGSASGEVKVTSVTDRSVAGTFTVVLVPFSAAASGSKTIEGTFNLSR